MNTYETPKSTELWLYNDCHKINPSGPFGVTSTQRFRAACSSKSRYFPGILTAYFNSKYFLLYTRELLGCLLGVSASGRNSCRGNNLMIGFSDRNRIIRENAFEQTEKKSGLKFQNGLALIGLRTTGTCSKTYAWVNFGGPRQRLAGKVHSDVTARKRLFTGNSFILWCYLTWQLTKDSSENKDD